MTEDFYPAAEKILSDIIQILQKDPKLSTIEIIPRTTNANKSPVYHEQHCLGLESWCIQPVYCHAYQCVMNMRQNHQGARDLNRLNMLLVGVLMINPDILTFWNMRKDLMNCGKLDPYFELHFSAVVLSRKPKSSDVYTHRKWVLNKILKGCNDKSELLTKEVLVCEAAADRYSNNYHAWTHRLWCLNQKIPLQANSLHFLLQELNWSQSWVLKHVSDHSGLHYRQQVLSKLCDALPLKSSNFTSLFSQVETAFKSFCSLQRINANVDVPCVFKMIIFELLFNTQMINDFVAHEALWYHRRFILYLFKCRATLTCKLENDKSWIGFTPEISHSNGDGVPSEKNQKIELTGVKLFNEMNSYEASFLKQFKTEKTDPMSKKYSLRHQQWLTNHLNFGSCS